MKDKIFETFKESARIKLKFVEENIDTIIEVSNLLAERFGKGNKLLDFFHYLRVSIEPIQV